MLLYEYTIKQESNMSCCGVCGGSNTEQTNEQDKDKEQKQEQEQEQSQESKQTQAQEQK